MKSMLIVTCRCGELRVESDSGSFITMYEKQGKCFVCKQECTIKDIWDTPFAPAPKKSVVYKGFEL